jgi:hypothetical protein
VLELVVHLDGERHQDTREQHREGGFVGHVATLTPTTDNGTRTPDRVAHPCNPASMSTVEGHHRNRPSISSSTGSVAQLTHHAHSGYER